MFDLDALATLAGLELCEEEKPRLQQELEAVLGSVQRLQAVEVPEGVPEREARLECEVQLEPVRREDVAGPGRSRPILERLPRREGDYALVPPMRTE